MTFLEQMIEELEQLHALVKSADNKEVELEMVSELTNSRSTIRYYISYYKDW